MSIAVISDFVEIMNNSGNKSTFVNVITIELEYLNIYRGYTLYLLRFIPYSSFYTGNAFINSTQTLQTLLKYSR